MNTKEEKHSFSHVLKYTSLFGGVQGLCIIISLIRNKFVAVLLGPNGMGLVALFNSVIAFVSQGTNLGLSFSAVRYVSEVFETKDEERIAHVISIVRLWSLLAAMLGMFVCVAIGPFLNNYTFSWGDHTFHFVLLAPVVGMMAIAGGETAILKASRRLKELALMQIWTVVVALVISIPIYYLYGISGIIPVFILVALATMLLAIFYSYRFYPLKMSGIRGLLTEGIPMVRLGVAFVVGSVFTAAAEVVIRSYLNVNVNLELVGLYNAGYMIAITYAGMVFTAMETDYFPRLAAVNHDSVAVNKLVNRQIEASLLLISPLLTAWILALPIMIPLLFTNEFAPVIPMTQLAMLAMYFKAVTLPIAYINLAKANSFAFLLFEILYAVLFVVFVIVGFNMFGLLGTGAALVLAHVVEQLMIHTYARVKYNYKMSVQALLYIVMQIPLGCMAYCATLISDTVLSIVIGALAFVVSLFISLFVISKKTKLRNKLIERFFKNS